MTAALLPAGPPPATEAATPTARSREPRVLTAPAVLRDMLARISAPGAYTCLAIAADAHGRYVPPESERAVAWSISGALLAVTGAPCVVAPSGSPAAPRWQPGVLRALEAAGREAGLAWQGQRTFAEARRLVARALEIATAEGVPTP